MLFDITIKTDTGIHQYRKASKTSTGAIMKAFEDAKMQGVYLTGASVHCTKADVERVKAKNIDIDFISYILEEEDSSDASLKSLIYSRYAHGFADEVDELLRESMVNFIDTFNKERQKQSEALTNLKRIFDICV